MRRKILVSTLAGVGVLLLATMGHGTRAQTGLVPGGEAPDVTLVFTGDVIGYLDPCG